MTTSTLTPPAGFDASAPRFFMSDANICKPQREYKKTNADGQVVRVFEGVPVFRSGTFRDSWGDQMTWEDLHIEQMVLNHNHLKRSGVFADVPVRKGHPGFATNAMDELIGYVTSLRAEDMVSPVDGVTYTYLLSDYEILDEEAQKKIASKLWRNRSAEIGMFGSNAEAEYWPTFMGFAYVDIPAVEGLHLNGYSKGRSTGENEFAMFTGETVGRRSTSRAGFSAPNEKDPALTLPGDDDGTGNGQHAAPDDDSSSGDGTDTGSGSQDTGTGDDAGSDSSDGGTDDAGPGRVPDGGLPEAVQDRDADGKPVGPPVGAAGSVQLPSTGDSLTGDDDDDEDDDPIEQTEDLSAGGPVGVDSDDDSDDDDEADEDEAEPVPLTEGPMGPVFSKDKGIVGHFTIGGRKTQDFGKVQKHINALEHAESTRAKAQREAFCKRLAKEGRILASDLNDTIAHAQGLTPAQFSSWSALAKRTPKNALFGRQPDGQVDSRQRAADLQQYNTQVEIIHNHLRSGIPMDAVKTYPSFASAKALSVTLSRDFEDDLKINKR